MGKKVPKEQRPKAANYYGGKNVADLTPKQRRRALKKARRRTARKIWTPGT